MAMAEGEEGVTNPAVAAVKAEAQRYGLDLHDGQAEVILDLQQAFGPRYDFAGELFRLLAYWRGAEALSRILSALVSDCGIWKQHSDGEELGD